MSQDSIRSLDELALAIAHSAAATFSVSAREPGGLVLEAQGAQLLLVEAGAWRAAERRRALEALCAPAARRVVVGREEELAQGDLGTDGACSLLVLPATARRALATLSDCLALVTLEHTASERARWAERYRYELGELVAIARAISSERDIHTLLGMILDKARRMTGADAGSVYIVEGRGLPPRERMLRFMLSQNDSIAIDLREATLPVSEQSIVGRAVIAAEAINIGDLHRLGELGQNPWGVQHDRQFDRKSGYQARSMLTVPMVNQRDEVLGVIQLINKKREGAPKLVAAQDFDAYVVPFDARSEELAATLAAQAGVSFENVLLEGEIRTLFDGFVNASVTAIESRDPTTSGHSMRVATLTVGLAEIVDRVSEGSLKNIRFSADHLKEIEYAGLLHDFGKVGVRESVLVKAKKLYPHDRDRVVMRFDYIRKSIEAAAAACKLELVAREGMAEAERRFGELEAELAARLEQLDSDAAFVLQSNEPSVLAQGSFERLAEIASATFTDGQGNRRPYLLPEEVAALSLPRGSLTKEERLEIESHVVHTYNFLENIPWGRKFGRIPIIAGSHHEKLDGSGYPRGLRGEEIGIESRMMTIADIFDALTASDRPYKRAVPLDKALDILAAEVKGGKCDAELYRLFLEAKVWQRVGIAT